jgi:hypothetical protein
MWEGSVESWDEDDAAGPVTIASTGGGGLAATGPATTTVTKASADNDLISPIDAWLANKRWTREDLELMLRVVGTVVTVAAFLYRTQ